MVTIYLNGKKEEVKDKMNIAQLLSERKIRPEVVTVELNDQIIERTNYDKTAIKERDKLEFVYYMGGGKETVLVSGYWLLVTYVIGRRKHAV